MGDFGQSRDYSEGVAVTIDADISQANGHHSLISGKIVPNGELLDFTFDADKANVLNIIDGKQSMTVWKDTRTLGTQVAKMVDQIAKGETVSVNDTKSYDNGKKVVPTYLVEPQVVTKDTVKSALVDSGFYKASDLGL